MHVLLFDIDGTLVNAGGAGQAAMEQALAEEFGELPPVDGIPTAGRTDFAITRDLFAYHRLPIETSAWERFLTRYFNRLPNTLAQRPGGVLPGVPELLGILAERDDVVLGLLTGNFAEGARVKLEHYGLSAHFEFGSYGDAHADRDDVARVAWETVRDRYPGVPRERVWVIGDTPADIRCARAIGAKAFAVATGMYPAHDLSQHAPDILRDSLSSPDEWQHHVWTS
jgi:phosphoglycolate phosphatase